MIINNRFEIEKELGRGGIGVVYLARDLQNESRLVVVKQLLAKPTDDHWVHKKFRTEAEALKRIIHPGVVGLIDAGNDGDGAPYLAMEYIPGRSLRTLIRPEGMNLERASRLIRQLGQALTAAHRHGIYHRDLKPDNIMIQMVDGAEQVKVIDFGIATVKESLDEKTQMTVAAGTIAYMSPEQLDGKPSASTDIYAFGVIAYELLTGRRPFNTDAISDARVAMFKLFQWQQEGIKVKPKDLRPDLPLAAQNLILKALSFNPRNRHNLAEEFGTALADALLDADSESPLYPGKTFFESDTVGPETQTQGFKGTSTPFVNQQITTAGPDSPGTKPQKPGTQDPSPIATKPQSEIQPAEAQARPHLTPSKPFPRWIAALTVAIVLTGVGFSVKFFVLNGNESTVLPPKTPHPTPVVRELTLSYWGVLQTYKNKKPVGEPTKLTGGVAGETYFNSGDGLKFCFIPSSDGNLYLILEEEKATGPSTLTIVFPSPEANNGTSQVKGGQTTATAEFQFDQKTGTEKVWVIWTASAVPEFEEAYRRWGNGVDEGEIKDERLAAFTRQYFGHHLSDKLQLEPDPAKELVTLHGKENEIVYLLKLKHR